MKLAPELKAAVEIGLLPLDIAEEFDTWSDRIADLAASGALTEEEVEALTTARAVADAARAKKRGYPREPAAWCMSLTWWRPSLGDE